MNRLQIRIANEGQEGSAEEEALNRQLIALREEVDSLHQSLQNIETATENESQRGAVKFPETAVFFL